MAKSVEAVVSVVRCDSYDQEMVDKAVAESIKNTDIEIKRCSKILIKPNLLIAKTPEQATCTHPSMVEAVIKILIDKECDIIVGDSSGFNTPKALETSGILSVCKKFGVKTICFEKGDTIHIKNPGGHVLKEISLTKTIEGIDYIISLPKMKTHSLMKMTGAVKNCYGLVPGTTKALYHTKGYNEEIFGELLIDIYSMVKPKLLLNIMDAVVGMEGEGPSNGEPKNTGLILASNDAVALDIIQARVMGFNPLEIKTITAGISRKMSHIMNPHDIDNITLVGEGNLDYASLHYKRPASHTAFSSVINAVASKFGANPIMIPEADKNKCLKCGICATVCPVKCITYTPYPTFDRKICIKCYCCQENCPHNAIFLKKS